MIAGWRKKFYACPKNRLAQNVCSRVDPFEVCLSRQTIETTQHVFQHKVKIQIFKYFNKCIHLSLSLSGRNRGQTDDQSKEQRSLLAVRRTQLDSDSVLQTIQSGGVRVLAESFVFLGQDRAMPFLFEQYRWDGAAWRRGDRTVGVVSVECKLKRFWGKLK